MPFWKTTKITPCDAGAYGSGVTGSKKKGFEMIETTDNPDLNSLYFPRYSTDTDQMYQIEMEEKSSLLIKGNLTNGTQALVNGDSINIGIEFSLKNPVSLNQSGGDSSLNYPKDITKAVLSKAKTRVSWLDQPEYYGTGSIWFKVDDCNRPYCPPSLFIPYGNHACHVNRIREKSLAKYPNIAAFLKQQCPAMENMSSEKICRFFHHSPYPRGENVTAPIYTAVSFPEMNPVTTVEAESIIENAVKTIDKPVNIPDSSIVFSFTNEWGEAEIKVAAIYDHAKRTKMLLAMTAFRQNGCNNPEMFCFLGKKVIPWSQNDLAGKNVVITENIEFCFWNRDSFLEAGKLLITFPETYGHYEYLDLNVLNQAASIQLLVANFNGETMAEACAAQLPFAEKINAALDTPGNFSVFLIALEFEPIPCTIQSTLDLMHFISGHRPRIMESCVAAGFAEYHKICDNFALKVQRKIEAEKALYTIRDERTEKVESTVGPDKRPAAKTQWAIRSVVDKGGHIELIGQEKTGKTNFAVTLAYGYITANQQKSAGLIPGRFWTASKSADKKAVYLDAELGRSRFDVIRDRVKGAYLPKKSKEAAELDTNFIYHDLYKDGIPYAKRENHQHILDLIAAAEHEGTPGPVGMVILDTRRGFTLNQIGLEPQFAELINKIRRRFGPNVFVCHHMDENNEAAGNTSVTTGKTGMITMCRQRKVVKSATFPTR